MKRLLLFDIDGTLLSTNGAARRAFHRALLDVYGTAGPIDDHPFDGKTDPQIARELLAMAGLSHAAIGEGLPRLWDAYLDELEAELRGNGERTSAYPGVPELLQALAARKDVLLGLLTGNVARGASLKLRAAGLEKFFDFGAFGSDREARSGLPEVAVERARARTGIGFGGRDVVIIGDTPSDVRCGEALGVLAVAVATGRHSPADLRAAGAHVVFENFADTAAVLRVLLPDA